MKQKNICRVTTEDVESLKKLENKIKTMRDDRESFEKSLADLLKEPP